MKLIYKIILPIILIIGFTVFLVSFLSLRSIKSGLYKEEFLRFQDNILKNQTLLEPAYFSDSATPLSQNKFEEFFNRVNMPAIARFIIWDTKQAVIFSDLKSLIGFKSPNHKDVLGVINSGEAFFEFKSVDYNEPVQNDIGDFLDVYAPISLNGQLVGVIESHLVVESLVSPVNEQLKIIIVIMTGGGLLILASILLILRAFVIKPVNNLEKASHEISRGNLSYPLSSVSTDEIGNLTRDFNKMRQALKFSIDNLEKEQEITLKKSLELERQNKLLSETEKAVMNLLEDGQISENYLKKERERLATIIFSMGEGLIVVDNNMKIILINSMAEKLLEISSGEAVGKKISEIVSLLKGEEKILTEELPVFKTLKTGESISVDLADNYYYQLPSGKKFPIILNDAPLRGNGIIGAVVVFKDATDEKALDESRSSFISTASHQLRTPLTAIRWYTEMLNAGDAGPLSDNQKKFSNEIYGGVLRLGDTLNLLLTLARVEGRRMKIKNEKINIFQFTDNLIKNLGPSIKNKNLSVEIKSNRKEISDIDLDQTLLSQVITNLLSNAIRYTNEGGHIEIGISCNDKEMIYYIKDDGMGIPEDQKNRVFEKFFRAENAMTKIPDGNGLGLVLVKSLVEIWKGKVWFESELGKGTTFYFTIPI